jgi:hypothetical protein
VDKNGLAHLGSKLKGSFSLGTITSQPSCSPMPSTSASGKNT